MGSLPLKDQEDLSKQPRPAPTLIDQDGKRFTKLIPFRFLYPHEVSDYDFLDLKSFFRDNPECVDPAMKYREKDALYRTWSREELFNSQTRIALPKEFPLLESRNPAIYAFTVFTAPLFDELSKAAVKEERMKPVRSGVRVVTMNSLEGRNIVLEPRFDASARERLFMIVELDDARSDLGRKGFHPDLEEEIKQIGLKIIKYTNRYRRIFLKSQGVEVGVATRLMGLHKLKEEAENRFKQSPLSCGLSFGVTPINEPETIAIFNELIGRDVLVGFTQIGCFHNSIYDGLFRYELVRTHPRAIFDSKSNPLGLPATLFKDSNPSITYPTSCLEYKVNLDSLIRDLANPESAKMFEDLALVVVWENGCLYKDNFHLEDLVGKSHPTGREIFGATHLLQRKGIMNGHNIQIIELRTIVNLIRQGRVKLRRFNGRSRKSGKS